MHNKLVFLVGLPAAGKSTIGKLVAKRLQRRHFDTDEEVERRAGVDIHWIFDVETEQGFRRREKQVLNELIQEKNAVISTGGGTILEQDNRQLLQQYGTIVYLQVSVEQQLKRTLYDKKRPMLQDVDDKNSILQQIERNRVPLYEAIADIVIKTNKPKKILVEKLCQYITDYENRSG